LAHLVAPHVLLEPRHVEADLLRDGERALFICRSAFTQQLLVKGEIFFSAAILHTDGDGDTCSFQRNKKVSSFSSDARNLKKSA
jgi:hypothetical protein